MEEIPVVNNGKIFQAIPAIMLEMDAIPKGQETKQGPKYKFRGIDDLYNACQKLLAKHGVFNMPEVIDSKRETFTNNNGTVMHRSILRIKYTFWADDGSWCQAVSEGEAMDSGDKSTSKAMAIAHKYALFQALMVATEDMEDPDGIVQEPQKSKPRAPEQRVNSQPPNSSKPAEQKKPNILDLAKYEIPVGQFKGRQLQDVDRSELQKAVSGATEYISAHPKAKDLGPITDFIDQASRFLLYSKTDTSELPNHAEKK